MFQQFGEAVGLTLKNAIITVAEVLTLSDSRPGQIVGLLALITLVLAVLYFGRSRRQICALRSLDRKIRSYSDKMAFAEGFMEFTHSLKINARQHGPEKAVHQAFEEYSETIVIDDQDGPAQLRNSIRPASFLNVEDLGFGPSFFRILPNTLVSVGLLLTFLGLVAALHQFSQSMTAEAGGMDKAMQSFMQIASAKFIMSLAGLACSILFTFLLRVRQNMLDAALRRLCHGIERHLVFVSLEDIG